MAASIDRHGDLALDDEAVTRLEHHVRAASRRARSRRRDVLAAVTIPLGADVDPTAIVVASRGPGEPWFAFEQPAAGAAAVAGLGCARAIESDGAGRFAAVSTTWRGIAADAVCDPPDGPPGSGLVALGGFAFADDGGAATQWDGYAPASLHVPEVAIARRDGEASMTVALSVGSGDVVEDRVARAVERVVSLRAAALPLVDPAPAVPARVASAMPPEHYVAAVERAIERIRAGELVKLVLAREVLVHGGSVHDPAAVLGALRATFPSCFVFCVGRGERAFVGATPELLLRRQGTRASTLALAGTALRSADHAVDEHLAEQLRRSDKNRSEHAIVVGRIVRALGERALWVTAPDEPVVVRIANVAHLATPIRAQLADPVDAIELAGALHPTPAVGAEPPEARALIPAHEGFDRGWYAGPIGWTDADGDGELCVALRCALLDGTEARCYAGVGVVADSDPAAELAETEAKLDALLPVLT